MTRPATAWVINQGLAPLAINAPLLVARKRAEITYIEEVVRDHPGKVYPQNRLKGGVQ